MTIINMWKALKIILPIYSHRNFDTDSTIMPLVRASFHFQSIIPRSQRAMYFCQQWIRGCHSHIAVATGDYLCSLLLFGLHNCSVIFCLNSRDEALSFAVIAMLQHLCVLWPSSGFCQIGSREYNGQNMVIASAIFSSMEKLNGTSLICTYFHVRYNLTKLLLICCL